MAAQTQRKKRRETPYSKSTGPVRLSHDMKQFIASKSEWGESLDQTLRRLLKNQGAPQIDSEKGSGGNGR